MVRRFAPAAAPGPIGTELLLHRLKCETGYVDRKFVFGPDTWNPRREAWPAYERRIRAAFGDALKLAMAGEVNDSQPTIQQTVAR